MPDILLDGIPVIDLLEITSSTQEVALQIKRDQSSVSRIYRQVSTRLGLNFAKQPDGQYRALGDHTLLQDLRLRRSGCGSTRRQRICVGWAPPGTAPSKP